MSDINAQIAELEAKIQQLRSAQVIALQEELKTARQTVCDLEAQLPQITGGSPISVKLEPRKRVASGEIKAGILKVLATAPTGMSQKEVAEATGISHPTVVGFSRRTARSSKRQGKDAPNDTS